MLLLHGVSVGGQSTRERERGLAPVMSVTKPSSLCKCLASKKFGSTVPVPCFCLQGLWQEVQPQQQHQQTLKA